MSRSRKSFPKGHRKIRDEEDEELIFNLQLKEFKDSISENLGNECKLDQSWVFLRDGECKKTLMAIQANIV